MRAVTWSHCAAALLVGLAAGPGWGQAPPEIEPRRSAERALTMREEAELRGLREQLGAARQRSEQLEAALARERDEASRLRRMLAERGGQEPPSDVRTATAEIERLRRANRDLSDRLDEAEQRARDLRTQLERERSRERRAAGGAAADLGRLREELAAAQAAQMSQAGQLQRLQRELEQLRAARAQAEERASAAERRERALQTQLGERSVDQDALSAGLAAAEREARDLRARVEAARNEAQRADAERRALAESLAAAQREARDLRARVEAAGSEARRAEVDRQASANLLAGTRAAATEVAALRAQVQTLESGRAALREQLAEAQARERDATEKAAQLDAARGEAAALRDALDDGPAQSWVAAAVAGGGALLVGAVAGALGARRWRPPKPREVPVSTSVRLGDWSFAVQRAPVSPSFAIRASLTSVQMSVRSAVLPLVRVP